MGRKRKHNVDTQTTAQKLAHVEKKLSEARFFVVKLREAERVQPLTEDAGFYLSAFLCAGRSTDRKLNTLCSAFEERWAAALAPDDRCVWNFLNDERNWEAHHVTAPTERVAQPAEEVVMGGVPVISGGESVTTQPRLVFVRDGKEEPAIELCDKYIGLLRRLIDDYRAGHPLPS